MKHRNNGSCGKCLEIIARYPGFYTPLKEWFYDFQENHPEAHVSEAGRGKEMQDILLHRKATRARYGESAHNYNCALDIFEQGGKIAQDIYEEEWFRRILAPNIPDWIEWYGQPEYRGRKDKFYELPHVELKGWREYARRGDLVLVEPDNG